MSKKQTTLRLPVDLHRRLRLFIAQADTSMEKFVETAINEALMAVDNEVKPEWGGELAQRFLECMPTPAVIKDSHRTIAWCNHSYEELMGRDQNSMLGRTVAELGVLDVESAQRVEQAFRGIAHNKPRDFWERLLFTNQRPPRLLLFRAHRFLFKIPTGRSVSGMYFGDISFPFNEMVPGVPHDVSHDIGQRLRVSTVPDSLADLFTTFLNTCPTAIAIKDSCSRIIWHNREYEQLPLKSSRIIGHTAAEIFDLPANHPVVRNDHSVIAHNRWMYAVESLPKSKPRTSLRFPIHLRCGGQRADLIGVVSAEFAQRDVSDSPFGPRRRRNTRRARKNESRPGG